MVLLCELFFRLRNAELDKIMKQWDKMCIDYRNNEENIEVVDETQFKIELEPPKNLDSLATSSGGGGIDYNSDVKNRDYNKDEDVLSYLRGEFKDLNFSCRFLNPNYSFQFEF